MYSFQLLRFHPAAIRLLWTVLAVSLPCALQAQQLHTYLDRDSVEVGEPFHVILVLQRETGDVPLEWPKPEVMESEDLHLVSREHFRPAETRDSLRFRFQYFGLRDTSLQSMTVRLRTEDGDTLELASPELPLFFRALTDEEDDFRPLKPLYEFARLIWPWLLLLILLSGLGYWLYRRWKQTSDVPPPTPVRPVPFMDPIQELGRSIQQATALPPSRVLENPSPSTVELGDAIRTYLERVYRLPALERTSREILMELPSHTGNPEIGRALKELFLLADRIKFAKYDPTVSDIQQLRQAALHFLEIVRVEDRERVEVLKRDHSRQSGTAGNDPMPESEDERESLS